MSVSLTPHAWNAGLALGRRGPLAEPPSLAQLIGAWSEDARRGAANGERKQQIMGALEQMHAKLEPGPESQTHLLLFKRLFEPNDC
eukprot:2144106-Rhodomonas_salina.4